MAYTSFNKPKYYEVIEPKTGDIVLKQKALYYIPTKSKMVWRKKEDKEIRRITKAEAQSIGRRIMLERYFTLYKKNEFPKRYVWDLLVWFAIILLLMKR